MVEGRRAEGEGEPYLYGQHFIIETDHQPLKWLLQMKNKNQRLTHWALSLQPFKCDIRHRAGAQHNNADGLLRGPPDSTLLEIQRGEECDEAELMGLLHANHATTS